MFILDNDILAFHAIFVLDVPKKVQKQLKLAIFWIFLDFWGQKTILRISIARNMCISDVWALDEAFGGVWEQYSQSKYQKTAKNAKIGKKMHFWKSRWGSRWSEPTIFNLSMDVLFHGKSKNGFKILGFLGKGGSRAQKWPPLGSNFFLEFFFGVLTPDLSLSD